MIENQGACSERLEQALLFCAHPCRKRAVTFSAVGSYYSRAMKATGRPGKKKALPKSAALRKANAPALAEERLLVEAAQAEPARFDALYELHFRRVYGFIAGRVHDRATAEDLTS